MNGSEQYDCKPLFFNKPSIRKDGQQGSALSGHHPSPLFPTCSLARIYIAVILVILLNRLTMPNHFSICWPANGQDTT
ncbi:MAG: hypothetical protein INR73_12860 [Williamsia sp.]|nr:hypothetical protein [Williamsia sp.]